MSCWHPSMQVQLLDVASQASVRAFARRWTDARRPLHVLVNNAGVFCFGGDGWSSSSFCWIDMAHRAHSVRQMSGTCQNLAAKSLHHCVQ